MTLGVDRMSGWSSEIRVTLIIFILIILLATTFVIIRKNMGIEVSK